MLGNIKHNSIWNNTYQYFSLKELNNNILADICVVGSGISGLTTAYLLQKAGKKVVILESGNLTSGETSKTGGHLLCAIDGLHDIIKNHGIKNAKLAVESHFSAIKLLEKISKDENIDCDFEYGKCFWCEGDKSIDEDFYNELNAAKEIGLNVKETESDFFKKLGKAMVFENQAKINIGKYMAGLVRVFLDLGGQIYVNSSVLKIDNSDKVYVFTKDGTVETEKIVIATGKPIYGADNLRQQIYRTFVLGFAVKDNYFNDLMSDLSNCSHYFKTANDGKQNIAIIGGKDEDIEKVHNMNQKWQEIEDWARKHFMGLGDIVYKWSGNVVNTEDGLAFIGKSLTQNNTFIITGTAGNGLTNGVVGSILINDLIFERDNPWLDVYKLDRN